MHLFFLQFVIFFNAKRFSFIHSLGFYCKKKTTAIILNRLSFTVVSSLENQSSGPLPPGPSSLPPLVPGPCLLPHLPPPFLLLFMGSV